MTRKQFIKWVDNQPTRKTAADILGITERHLYRILGGAILTQDIIEKVKHNEE